MSLYRFGKAVCSLGLRLLFRFRVVGKENIPQDSGYVVICNHRSYMDPPMLGSAIPQTVHFMAKAELFKPGFFDWLLRHLDAFPVERGKGDGNAITRAETIIKQGGVLGIFPEGTRSLDGVPLRPKSGAAMIAGQTHSAVLPCAVCFEGKLRFRSRITFRIGSLIPGERLTFTQDQPSAHELKESSYLLMGEIVKLLEQGL